MCQDLGRALNALEEVCGGGKDPKQLWYNCSDPPLGPATLFKDAKELGEGTVVQAYGTAIKKRSTRLSAVPWD